MIYFDFGGVLVNYDDVFKGACKKFGIDFSEALEFYSQFDKDLAHGRMTTEEFWNKCVDHFSLNSLSDFDIATSWVSDYQIITPINTLVYELEGKIEMGIISNINSGIWEAAYRDGWVPKIKYKEVYLSYKMGMTKPDRRIYEIIQKETGYGPEEIMFVDDQDKNLLIPKEMGWRTIHFDMRKAEEGAEKIRKYI